MRFLTRAFQLILPALLLVQCQKEISYTGSPDSPVVLPNPVTANLQGTVLDENGLSASGVTVRAGSKTATTDSKGYFRINDAALDKNSSVVTAEKSGYFKGYRSFMASGTTNQVQFKLIKRDLAGTISAASGGTASLANGSKIELPAAGIVVASSGAAYSGDVKVFAAYIDPTAADIASTVPGSMMADDRNGKRVTLGSYGMLAVELEGVSGEKLQIKSGATANLTTPIPASLQSSAPASIALWSVNEQTGIWKEEGSATRNGSVYVGAVKHFSFWNCDISIPAVMISLTIKNADSVALRHVQVKVTRTVTTANVGATYGWTDSLGGVHGLVPANEILLLTILDPCGNTAFSQQVGPFAQATNLGTIYLPSNSSYAVTFKGKLLTCAGTPVINGFAIIHYDNTVRHAATNQSGDYVTSFIRCGTGTATATVVGVDATNQQQSSPQTVTLTAPITNAGTQNACGTSSVQFINYTLDGTSYSINSTVAGDSLTAFTGQQSGTIAFRTYFSGFRFPGNNGVSLSFNHPTHAAGTYTAANVSANAFYNSQPVQPFNIVVTNYPTIAGQFYEGSFSGNFIDSAGGAPTTHTLSGSFKLRK